MRLSGSNNSEFRTCSELKWRSSEFTAETLIVAMPPLMTRGLPAPWSLLAPPYTPADVSLKVPGCICPDCKWYTGSALTKLQCLCTRRTSPGLGWWDVPYTSHDMTHSQCSDHRETSFITGFPTYQQVPTRRFLHFTSPGRRWTGQESWVLPYFFPSFPNSLFGGKLAPEPPFKTWLTLISN